MILILKEEPRVIIAIITLSALTTNRSDSLAPLKFATARAIFVERCFYARILWEVISIINNSVVRRSRKGIINNFEFRKSI